MRLRWLRAVLVLDSALLFLLGGAFIFLPRETLSFFGFTVLPEGVHYILGLWGCGIATMGIGYFTAALDPLRHVVWVQVGIARGAAECLLGLLYVMRGTVSPQQAGFGIAAAGVIALAYGVLYPRKEGANE